MITSTQLTVSSTAVQVVATSQAPKRVSLHCHNTADVYISGANTVTSANGFLVDKAAGVFTVQIDSDEELWAIAAAGSHTLTVLVVYL